MEERVPRIRFKGFNEGWERERIGEIMNVTSVKRIHQSDWTDHGVRFLRARDIVAELKNEEQSECLFISKEKRTSKALSFFFCILKLILLI